MAIDASPHEWQVLLAIGLGSAQVDPEGSQTPRGIAAALPLDIEDVYDAVDSLRRERLAAIEFRDPEVPEAEQEWSLTRSGADAAAQIVGFAGRVIRWRLRRHQRSAESARTLSLQADSSPR